MTITRMLEDNVKDSVYVLVKGASKIEALCLVKDRQNRRVSDALYLE